ncbi:hypothetical protein [Rhodoblastus sp.]|uniref:hypothetical protein n=1 Tax=Rhodoblastus sp. TaxID=1962975 RepID=UPI0026040BB9|nr:hypothetical protein [Rhodoblastus sp.]
MTKILPALLLLASLSGCNQATPPLAAGWEIPPYGARVPERSLRMAIYQCAKFDPFSNGYVDRISTMPEGDLYAYATSAAPAHIACMRSLGWETAPGSMFGLNPVFRL